MTKDYKVLSIFLIIIISLIFLDAYVFFSIPIAWIGQLLLFLLALTKFNIFKDTFNTSIFSTIILLVTVPQIYVTFFTTNPNQDITYTMLRYFNIVSFLVVFAFTINVSSKNKSLNDEILRKLKNFCFIFSWMLSSFMTYWKSSIFDWKCCDMARVEKFVLWRKVFHFLATKIAIFYEVIILFVEVLWWC